MTALMLATVLSVGGISPGESAGTGVLSEADAAYFAGLAERGNSARARPHFARAGVGYQHAWEQGTRTPAVARAMSQSRLLAGDLGGAIRDYRQGLRRFPHDRELQRGLAYARGRVDYPLVGDLADATRPRDPPSLLDRLPVPIAGIAGIAVGVWAVGWFALARAWMTVHGGLAVLGGTLVLTATLLGAWLEWEDARLRARWAEPTAVVAMGEADLRTGNSDEFPKRIDGRLPAGIELKVLGQRGGWLHVELADGTVGWVSGTRVVTLD